MASKSEHEVLEVGGREVTLSNPHKVLFPEAGYTKRDLVHYYLAVSEGALRGAGGRPNVLVRYPNGVGAEFFYQKRAPSSRPSWLEVVALRFPSGRSAEELVPRDAAALAWMANLACLELHPHPVRADDLEHPDELRVDLDPVPGVTWSTLREVANVVHETLADFDLVGFPKTSGSRGIHIYVRIARRFRFDQVRRAALALAREVERRAPSIATSKWWKEERHGVFLDYNQNAKDRTVASAYSVRPTPDARVSAPVTWDELAACDPRDFTLKTMPARFRELGCRHAAIDERAYELDALLELAARHERDGLGDAPWPPHYTKQAGEPPRVRPSHAKKPRASEAARSTENEQARAGERAAHDRGRAAQNSERAHDGEHATRSAANSGRRKPKHPLIEIGRAATKDAALAGFTRWQARYPEAAAQLAPSDVLVDAMRGRYTTWTRVRVNLQHVEPALRPPQEPLDPDEQPDH